MFCNKPRTLLRFLYVFSIYCVKLLSKHVEANLKHLLGMEFANDVIFLVLLSVNNYLVIYVFARGVGCKITYVGCTELTMFHILVLRLPARSTSVTEKPGCSD